MSVTTKLISLIVNVEEGGALKVSHENPSVHPLAKEIEQNNIPAVISYLEEKKEKKALQEAMSLTDSEGKTVFMLVCKNSALVNLFNLFLTVMNPESLKIKDRSGKTALMYAMANHTEDDCLKLLKISGDSAFVADDNLENALMHAIKADKQKLMQAFLAHPTLTKHISDKNKEHEDAFYLSIKGTDFSFADELLKRGAELEGRDNEENTWMMKEIAEMQNKSVQFLKSRGASLESRNKAGNTALIEAVKNGEDYKTRYLIEQGADLSARDATGKTLLQILEGSEQNEHRQSIRLLLTNPPRLPTFFDYEKFFIEALTTNDHNTIRYIIDAVEPRFMSLIFVGRKTVFHIAAEFGHLETLQTLYNIWDTNGKSLAEDPDPFETRDEAGNTPLHLAVANGRLEMVKYFGSKKLLYFWDRNAAGETIIPIAKRFNQQVVLRYLEAEKLRLEELNTMAIPQAGFKIDSFIKKAYDNDDVVLDYEEYMVLRPKGLALIQHYFSTKAGNHVNGYVACNDAAIVHALSLMKKVDYADFVIIALIDKIHTTTLKCERYLGKNHIIRMDSVGPDGGYHDNLLEIINQVFTKPKEKKNTFFYFNKEARQGASQGQICSGFASKDSRKLRQLPLFHREISTKYMINIYTDKINIISYNAPFQFTRLTASPDKLRDYISTHPEEAAKTRQDKKGQIESLMQYALHPRSKYGITTPKQILNRNFSLDRPGESQFVQKNLSGNYFMAKYIHIVADMLKTNSQDNLRMFVEDHDAAKLTIGPGKKIMSMNEKLALEQAEQLRIEKEKKAAFDRTMADLDVLNAYPGTESEAAAAIQDGTKRSADAMDCDLGPLRSFSLAELRKYIASPANPWSASFIDPLHSFDKAIQSKNWNYAREYAEDFLSMKGKGMEPSIFYFQKPPQSKPLQSSMSLQQSTPLQQSVHSESLAHSKPLIQSKPYMKKNPPARVEKRLRDSSAQTELSTSETSFSEQNRAIKKNKPS